MSAMVVSSASCHKVIVSTSLSNDRGQSSRRCLLLSLVIRDIQTFACGDVYSQQI